MIRFATENDREVLFEMAKKFHAASPYRELPVDDQTVRGVVDALLSSSPDTGLVLVLEKGEAPLGMIAGTLSPFPWNKNLLCASETVWWVEEGHRGGGRQLHKYFEYWAKKKGAHLVHMASLNTPSVNRYYERCNYIPTEVTYVKAI